MADDPFSDITASDESKSGGDPFGDITAPEPEQRGIVARTTEGFRGAYSPVLEGAADKLVDKEKHPYIHKATQAAIDANPISWADKALAGVMGATGAAAGAGAGVAEKTGMVNKAEADRLQRDLTIIGQGAMIEPGMGLAAAKAPHAAERVAPTGGEAALHGIITGKPTPAAEPAPAPAARAPVYDAITGERVEHLPEAAPETPPLDAEIPKEPINVQPEARTENAARTTPERDPFADIQEEPPAHVTERIPDEAQPAGPPEEAAPTPQEAPPDPAGAPVDSGIRDQAIETHAKSIVDAYEQEGVPKSELDTETLYDAADRLYRGEAKNPVEAYDQAVMEKERNAQYGGVRGAGEEVHPAGSEGAGPGTEKAVPLDRAVEQGAGTTERVPEAPVSAKVNKKRQQFWTEDSAGRPVRVNLPRKPRGSVSQAMSRDALFGDEIKQMELSWLTPEKKPDQALIQRQDTVRGPRSGRPLKTKRIPIGTEEAILEKGYEKAIGEKGEAREPGIEPMLRDAGNELLTERLAVNNWGKLASISRGLKFGKINAVEARTLMQDKFLRIKMIEDQWRRDHPGKLLPEKWSTYQAESLYYGKTGRRLEDNDKTHTDPIIKDIKKAGLTLEDVDDFLYARHAPERNAAIRKINPDIANPSGMSDAEAAAVLKRIDASGKRAAYDVIGKKVRKTVIETLDNLVADGLVAKDTADVWKRKYPNYVPLRGLEGIVEGINHGKGYDVRGPESMRALGRRSRADSPLAYVFSQAQQAIVRGERNRVGQVAGRFFSENPEPGLWSVDKAPLKRIIDKKTGLVKEIENPTWRQQDNVFAYKVNGEPHYIRFEGEYGMNIARALKNLGSANMGAVMRLISTATRTVARMSTTWNPEFMLGNFFRDTGEAFLNMRGEQKKGIARSFAKNLIPSIGGVYRGMKGKETGKYTELYHRFDKAGGRINFFGLETPEDIPANINAKLRRLNARGIKSAALATKDAVLHGLEIVNGAVENGTRLAAFKAGIEHGMTDTQAASFARELTVNFNRKGELGSTISGLYMFANAGIQGQARMMGAMKSKKVRRGAYALAGAGALTAIYNIANGGKDEDGKSKYSKIPSWERDTNMIFMWPDGSGRYSKLPLPYGYSFFKVMGERTAAMLYDNEDPKKATGAILGSTLDAFDPLGRDQGIAHFAPTLTKPLINLATNTNAFGRPINRPPEPWNKHLPKSAPERASQSDSAFSKGVAEKINEWTGGSQKIPGSVNLAPGDIDYGLGFASGGLGRFVMNTAAAGTRVYNGQEWQPEKTPVVRRFYGEKSDQADRALYFEERDQAAGAFQQKKRGPDYDSANKFKAADKEHTKLRKQMDRIRADTGLSPKEQEEQIKDLQAQELSHMLEARQFLERKRAESEGREPKFAEGGTVEDDGDVNDMQSPAFKRAVNAALASGPDALAKRQEFYPNLKINPQAWDEHVKAMPESLNIEDRRPGYKGGLHQAVRRHYGYKQGGLA